MGMTIWLNFLFCSRINTNSSRHHVEEAYFSDKTIIEALEDLIALSSSGLSGSPVSISSSSKNVLIRASKRVL
ncbi:hypothetical protein HanIR_Chr01g0031821 [Helianthus annuus]|nr:hypothetical protein HanIR_Chr01g0031821 [Helianthus annuus]